MRRLIWIFAGRTCPNIPFMKLRFFCFFFFFFFFFLKLLGEWQTVQNLIRKLCDKDRPIIRTRIHVNYIKLNSNKPNGFSHPYILRESICHLRCVRCIFFIFCSLYNWKSCKQTVKTLIRRRIMRCLIWFCTVCLCPTKGMPGLVGLNISILWQTSNLPAGAFILNKALY